MAQAVGNWMALTVGNIPLMISDHQFHFGAGSPSNPFNNPNWPSIRFEVESVESSPAASSRASGQTWPENRWKETIGSKWRKKPCAIIRSTERRRRRKCRCQSARHNCGRQGALPVPILPEGFPAFRQSDTPFAHPYGRTALQSKSGQNNSSIYNICSANTANVPSRSAPTCNGMCATFTTRKSPFGAHLLPNPLQLLPN